MAQVTGYTAPRMKAIEDSAIVDGDVVGNDLILRRFDGQLINAGNVRGPIGLTGPVGQVPEAVQDNVPYARKNGLWVPTTDAPIRATLAYFSTNNVVEAVGRIMIATDSNPTVIAIGDGVTGWNQLQKFYARTTPIIKEINGPQNATNFGFTDRTGMVVTFTVADVPWVVMAKEQLIYSTAAGQSPVLQLRDAGGVVKKATYGAKMNAISEQTYYGNSLDVLEVISTPGTYTRKVTLHNYAAGMVTFGIVSAGNEYTGYLIARPV